MASQMRPEGALYAFLCAAALHNGEMPTDDPQYRPLVIQGLRERAEKLVGMPSDNGKSNRLADVVAELESSSAHIPGTAPERPVVVEILEIYRAPLTASGSAA